MVYQNYLALIASHRVTPGTREVLLQRLRQPSLEHVPQSFSRDEFSVLQIVLGHLIPQKENGDGINLAAVLDILRVAGTSDGWRYATMPPNDIAVSLGLHLLQSTAQRLHGADFASLDEIQQRDLLRQVQKGQSEWPELDGRKWFEYLLTQATEIYVSHPATLAAMGFSGIAFLPHWPTIGLSTPQPWEPVQE